MEILIILVGLFLGWLYCFIFEADPAKHEAEKFDRQLENLKHGASISDVTKQPEKKASVAKRAAVGAIIAGETGAIIGAASAVNENIKNSKEN